MLVAVNGSDQRAPACRAPERAARAQRGEMDALRVETDSTDARTSDTGSGEAPRVFRFGGTWSTAGRPAWACTGQLEGRTDLPLEGGRA
jgi:hypothetical protein